MIDPGAVAWSRRGPALTPWGKAAVVGLGLLVLALRTNGQVGGGGLLVVAAVGVACLVDAVFAFVGSKTEVLGIHSPATAVVGGEVATRIELACSSDLLATIPGYPAVRPTGVDRHRVTTIAAPMFRRATFDEFLLQVLRPGPLGLAVITQRALIPLPDPLVVLPPAAPTVVPDPPPRPDAAPTDASAARGDGPGPVQQVREHQPGDGLRSISWSATARRGDLVVAQRDRPEPQRTHVVVDLGAGGPDGEAVVARALTVVAGLLARGDDVDLTGWVDRGPRTRPPRWPYLLTWADAVPPELVTVPVRSMRDAQVVLGQAVGGHPSGIRSVDGPAYALSPYGDRWVDDRLT